MSTPSAAALQQYLRRLCERAAAPADAVLLKRFAQANDKGAFEALIARHGPMVLGSARRLVDKSHDAEDVFQAVFLSLARLAKTIRQGQALPAWLHKATCRIAAKVRANRSARALPSPPEPPPQPRAQSDPAEGLVWQEVRQALDEELQRLPDRLRAPLVLCYLSGLTRDEAANELGWSLGTLKRRLEEGRKTLRLRLERRGIAAVGLALTVLTPEALQAAVSKPLLDSSQPRFQGRAGHARGALRPRPRFGRSHERGCHEIDPRACRRHRRLCGNVRGERATRRRSSRVRTGAESRSVRTGAKS